MTAFERSWADAVVKEVEGYMRKRILNADDRASIAKLARSVGMHPVALKEIEGYMAKKILSREDRESVVRIFREVEI